MKICVIGSYAKALVMTTDRIPQAGETLVGRDYRETYGGKGSDMAVQAARLGADVGFVGVVGEDAFGRELVALLADEGVSTGGVRLTPEHPTGVGFIVKDVAGRNVIVVDMGANATFRPADVDAHPDQLDGASVVLAQLEIPLATALHGLRVGRRRGATSVLNPAPAVDLRQVDLTGVDVITPNETEARVCVGLAPDADVPDEDIARQLMDRGAGAVVMTLGGAGSLVVTPSGATRVDAWPVDVVDSNGAGDSFNAGLCVALAEGRDLVEAARFAGAVAGLCCTAWETVPSYHRRDQVEAFLATHQAAPTA
ncbi:MAG: ribokinase [Actinomycetota bacterium]|nr:ribokinase [Actinomycetota bacterium]